MKPIWSGYLSFGLINIPVKMYSASKDRPLNFKLLDKHGLCPISYVRVCRKNEKEVPYEDIVKGYEYKKGDYVVLSDKDFRAASPKKTKAIDIDGFTSANEIDPMLYEKPYYLEPDQKSEKAYVLLRESLKRAKKVGIARFVLKDKEHLVIIKPEEKALMLIQLRFQDEVVPPKGLRLPIGGKPKAAEVEMAMMLIDKLTKHFKASQYHDTYSDKLKVIIRKKAKGKKISLPKQRKVRVSDTANLMANLKRSLAKEKAAANSK